MGFTRLDSSADATPAVMLNPAAATCWRSMTMNPSCHGNRRARYNCRGVTTGISEKDENRSKSTKVTKVTDDSNRASHIKHDFIFF